MSSKYTETERCIQSLLAIFRRYAGKDGDGTSLTKEEFKIFLHTELPSFTKNQKDPALLKKLMDDLDTVKDGKLEFLEFLNFIGILARASYNYVTSASAGGAPKRP